MANETVVVELEREDRPVLIELVQEMLAGAWRPAQRALIERFRAALCCSAPALASDSQGGAERCICVKDRLGDPLGFDSHDPVSAKPCPVHSPEYREQSEQPSCDGSELIAAERARQVSSEGWTPEHDDQHDNGELTSAAIAYAFEVLERLDRDPSTAIDHGSHAFAYWPWELEAFKPDRGPRDGDGPIRNLVKAAALLAAEIDRLQRLRTPASPPEPSGEEFREPPEDLYRETEPPPEPSVQDKPNVALYSLSVPPRGDARRIEMVPDPSGGEWVRLDTVKRLEARLEKVTKERNKATDAHVQALHEQRRAEAERDEALSSGLAEHARCLGVEEALEEAKADALANLDALGTHRRARRRAEKALEAQATLTVEQARMQLREAFETSEWPRSGSDMEYFIRRAFPDCQPEKGGEG